jgi:hypothetical protein
MVIYASLFKTKFSFFWGSFEHLQGNTLHKSGILLEVLVYQTLLSQFVTLKKKKEIKTILCTAENSCFPKELLHKLDKRIRPNNEYVHTETIKKKWINFTYSRLYLRNFTKVFRIQPHSNLQSK